MARYLSGLCAAGLGVCGGGWLIVTAVLLGGAPSNATLATLATGAGVALVSVVALWCWSLAWRQRMRRDGVLRAVPRATSPRQARRSRRALRREMRRTARNRAGRGPRQGGQPRQARPDAGLAGLGLADASIADLVPDPRAPESQPPSPPPPLAPAVACTSSLAADAATLVDELRAILEALLAASGEGEEAW